MKLAESLYRNIMETTVGRIVNRFKARSRRNVLFFEDIIANYIKECEKAGYGKEMEEIGRKWMALCAYTLVPDILKKMPFGVNFMVLSKIWENLGYMDDLHITKENNTVKIKTKNEVATRKIGKNELVVGLYTGILNVLTKSQIALIGAVQTKRSCHYTFKIKDKPFSIKSKEKAVYNKLNALPKTAGFSFKDAVKNKIFMLDRNNRVYFRGKSLIPIENTIFHVTSNQGPLIEKLPHISYNYFKEIINPASTDKEKLNLLKTLLQVMGWGFVNIATNKNKISVTIAYPPHGLQIEKDNYEFLLRCIQGFLWLLNKNYKISNTKTTSRKVTATYVIR